MSTLDAAVERFASGRHIIVGDARETLVVVSAATINTDRLDRLESLGDGRASLAFPHAELGRLGLLDDDGRSVGSLTAVGAGDDRARSMRVAAASAAVAADIQTPGHVDVIGIDSSSCGIAASRLATLAGLDAALAVSVVQTHGRAVPLHEARRHFDLAHLPAVSAAQLAAATVVDRSRGVLAA